MRRTTATCTACKQTLTWHDAPGQFPWRDEYGFSICKALVGIEPRGARYHRPDDTQAVVDAIRAVGPGAAAQAVKYVARSS